MQKVRYFQVDFPFSLNEIADHSEENSDAKLLGKIKVVEKRKDEVTFRYTIVRLVPIRSYLEDGSVSFQSVPTEDIYDIRIFVRKRKYFLSIIDPPRGSRVVTDFLTDLSGNDNFFFETMEITKKIIDQHINFFDSSKLVSAKISDLQIYDGAVARLEVTSQAGLQSTIAPFVVNKFHRIDALTYEVTKGFCRGLVYYYRNGTVKVSNSLEDCAFFQLEQCFA